MARWAVTVGDDLDPVLAAVADDYDAGALAADFGCTMRWPLERAVPDALASYAAMMR